MEKTLVILAAGMGSRFGGLKQMTPVGPNGEFIMDYSIYDALLASFSHVVFVIRRQFYDDFVSTIGSRIEKKVKVDYVFQENEEYASLYPDLLNREKPLGTVHALLCAKEKVSGPFVLINADDFYGREAYFEASKLLDSLKSNEAGAVFYPLSNVCSDHGSVKRGVGILEDNKLKSIDECVIVKENESYKATSLVSNVTYEVSKDQPTSMSFWCFLPDIFEKLEIYMNEFLKNEENRKKNEALLPIAILSFIHNDGYTINISNSKGTWLGMTYKEDQELVEKKIKNYIEEKIYPECLWR